jgi:hypothetical protein
MARAVGIFAVVALILALPAVADEKATPPKPAAMTRRVDELLNERLVNEKIPPGELCSDAEFLRRAYVDLTGRIPRVSDVRAFLSDSDPDRRAKLIDQLLTRPTHATHLANTWRRFLLPESADINRFGGDRGFEFWLRQQFADNTPYDKVARELLTAKGQANVGPTLFYVALENKPEELAAATSRAFLGVQIQCAQCHDHPRDKWKQDEFWGYAAFFARLQRSEAAMPGAALMVSDTTEGEVQHPLTKAPVQPRFLESKSDAPPGMNQTRREQLAAWMTAKENRYFASAAVNRVWALLFGRGLVEPVDDLGEHNPPSHPELMRELTDYFVESGYDVRGLIRVLANTEAYQRTSQLTDGETPAPPESFARMAIKAMTAEQLYDSLQVAICRKETNRAMMQQPGLELDSERAAFLDKFRGPQGSRTEFHAGIPQALTLMNGQMIGAATNMEQSDLLLSLKAPFFTDDARVETLFISVLARKPSPEEKSKYVSYLENQLTDAERRRALSDMLWALLNTAEFTLNH